MCVNCNDSLQVNLPVAPAGANGANGQSAYVYIASASNTAGTSNFTYPAILDDPNTLPGRYYLGFLNTNNPITNPTQADFTTVGIVFDRVVGINGAAGAAGAAGTNGADGVNGAISLNYKWNNDTTASPPAASYVKVNNANVGIASSLYINITDANSYVVGNVLARMITSTSTTKSVVTITAKGDPTTFAHFAVTGGTLLSGTYYIAAVTPLSASSTAPFTLNDDVVFSFSVVGDIGSTGPSGPTGPQGPQGPAGSSTIARPAGNTFDIDFINSVDTAVDADFYIYATNAGSQGQFNANTTVTANITTVYINYLADGGTDYFNAFRYMASTYFSQNPAQLFSITDITAGTDANFWIRRADYGGGILTLYVEYNTGALANLSLGVDYEIFLETDLQVELSNTDYNRVLLKNNSGITKNVRFKAPLGASNGQTILVEAVADSGNANNMNLSYVYQSTGSYNTLVESWDYANRPSDGTSSPTITNLNLLNAGQSCLLKFLVVPGGLAYIGGDKFVR